MIAFVVIFGVCVGVIGWLFIATREEVPLDQESRDLIERGEDTYENVYKLKNDKDE